MGPASPLDPAKEVAKVPDLPDEGATLSPQPEATHTLQTAPEGLEPQTGPEPPSRRRRTLVVALVLGAVVVAGLVTLLITSGNGGGKGGDAGHEAASGAIGTITTSDGDFTVSEAKMLDRYPEGCSDTTCMLQPQEGRQLLMVFFEVDPGYSGMGPPGSDQAYVVSGEGVRETVAAQGVDLTDQPVAYVAFAPSADATGFVLHWPNNEPISLGV